MSYKQLYLLVVTLHITTQLYGVSLAASHTDFIQTQRLPDHVSVAMSYFIQQK